MNVMNITDLQNLYRIMLLCSLLRITANPPYQDETVGNQKQFAPPVYDRFLDEAFKIGEKVEMIHPARFLYNAGGTSKAWNEKMLDDEHLKVFFMNKIAVKCFQIQILKVE